MRILITGATGFIGRHVVEALSVNELRLGLLVRDVAAAAGLTKEDDIVIQGDLDALSVSTQQQLREFSPDVCVHLAWAGIPDYSAQVSLRNLERSLGLVGFLVSETPCRKVVVTGSCMEYGRTQGECVESDPVTATSYFSWAKQALCNYLALLAADGKLDFVWFRLFYVYGPGQRSDSLLPTAIRDMLQGRLPTILNPFNEQDFVYVADVAQAVRTAVATTVDSGIYNLGTGQPTSVLDMCRLAERLIGGSLRVTEALSRQRPLGPPTCFWANTSKARQHLGWMPRYALADGVQRQMMSIREAESCSSTQN